MRTKESDVFANKDFEYKVKVIKQKKIDLPTGKFVTNCLKCNFTCHYACDIAENNKKFQCAAMDNEGSQNAKCKVCPNKCRWNFHINNPYQFELYEEEEKRTSNDHYQQATSQKVTTEKATQRLHDKLAELNKAVLSDIEEARQCIKCLSEIALKPNPLTETEYIDLLIESEKQEKKAGFQDCVKSFMKMREHAVLMSKMNYEAKR